MTRTPVVKVNNYRGSFVYKELNGIKKAPFGNSNERFCGNTIDVLLADVKKFSAKGEDTKLIAWILNHASFGTIEKRAAKVRSLIRKDDFAGMKKLIAVAEKARLGRFDLTVSNPAYQARVEGHTMSVSVYHKHMEIAQHISDLISMVYPSKHTMGGGTGDGLKEFSDRELDSTHYVNYSDFSDASTFFSGVEIKGGINYFLWAADKTEPGLDAYYDGVHHRRDTIRNGRVHVRSIEPADIISKVDCRNSMEDVVSSRNYYGSAVAGYQKIEQHEEVEPGSPGSMKVLYPSRGKGIVSRHISSSHTKREIGKWKVISSNTASNTKGRKLRRQDRMMIVEPGTIVADNFLVIGQFDTEQEAINMIRYMKTELSSYMYGILTPTHHAPKASYALIPRVNPATGELADRPGVFLNFGSPGTLDEQQAAIYGFTDGDRDLMTRDVKLWKSRVDVEADK